MKRIKKQKTDKVVVMILAIAAVLIISGLGFNTTQELTNSGTGFAIASGFALMAPAILSIILFAFIILRIRK